MKNVLYRVSGSLKNTDFVMENTFWIGLYPGLTDKHLYYSVDIIKKFFKI